MSTQITALEIYKAYPRKVGKAAALKAIEKAMRTRSGAELLEATQAYAEAVKQWPDEARCFVCHPATWFNQERFDDDRTEWRRVGPASQRSEFSGRF